MENGILVALSRQDTLQRQLAVIAHNLANGDTAGFKRAEMMFADHPSPSPLKTRRGEPAIFVRDVATPRDPRQGELATTANPLDLAIRGDGYFVVATPDGPRYTRNGHLRLDAGGQLVTANGLAVLGQGDQPIVLTQADTGITVGRDGSLSSDAGPVGRLRIVDLDDGGSEQDLGGGLLRTDGPVEDVALPVVEQGMIERSNVQPIFELERMIHVHRAYEQTGHFLQREDERIRKAVEAYVA
ncbi:MAG: flagellar hook-basal body complex protein [Rhodospirillales bacterium]|jgi:flagellar basal-body rod protein FlgF|nr:flagellar hook-basal body complex protein [Rhodospirillales bacterium]